MNKEYLFLSLFRYSVLIISSMIHKVYYVAVSQLQFIALIPSMLYFRIFFKNTNGTRFNKQTIL